MKKLFFLMILPLMLVACSGTREVRDCSTYQELKDPNPAGDWSAVKPGMNISFGSIDLRYEKHTPPVFKENLKYWEGSGWKGERISAQLVIYTTDDISRAEFETADLKCGKNIIPAANIQPQFVRYVMTDEFAGGCGYRKPENFASSLSADVLDNVPCLDIPANSVRPVWISIDIPRDIEAGVYKGKMNLYCEVKGKKVKRDFDLTIDVLDRTLTPPSEWAFYLDQWQHPTSVARFHNLPLWSDEHFEKLRPVMQRLANAGQKVITATLNKDPWNGQCYDRYGDMVNWTKNADNTWTYDYTNFDKWVNFMMDLGITQQINCYSVVPWNNELHYYDAATKDTITVQAVPGTASFEAMWTPFLKDFKEHMRSKGWLDKTNIAMDERDPKTMKTVIGYLQKQVPEMGIAFADNHKSYKEYPFLKDISLAFGSPVDSTDLVYRREHGLVTTFYVCCSDKFPNTFTFSDPSEGAFYAWYAVAAGYDGFLRWAYNSWVENPLLDTRFRAWPAGDTNLVYPDNRSSIRWERMMEGLQGVEKLRLIREDLKKSNDLISLAKTEKINKLLAEFDHLPMPEVPCAELVARASRLVNELSK